MSARAWGRRRQARWRLEFVIASFWACEWADPIDRDKAIKKLRQLANRARQYGVSLD